MKTYLTHKLDNEDDDDFFPNKLGYSYTQEVRTHVTVHLNQPFMQPDYYDNIVDALRRASGNDVFEFILNSQGGRFDGLISLLDAIESTDALTVATIVGECSSAASIFALSCHQVQVGPYAELLAHSARYGFAGKSADNVSHVLHTAKITDKVFRKAYEGFLSEEEINEVLNGKELYMDAEEIMTRLEAREKYFEELQKYECHDPEYSLLPEQEDFDQEEFFENAPQANKVNSKRVNKKKE